MKKTLFLLLFISITSIAYCQNETKNYKPVVNEIDSLIKKYDVKEITVSSAHGLVIEKRTADFYFDKEFLIVNKLYYFNMEKLVSFNLNMPHHTYCISFYFN